MFIDPLVAGEPSYVTSALTVYVPGEANTWFISSHALKSHSFVALLSPKSHVIVFTYQSVFILNDTGWFVFAI